MSEAVRWLLVSVALAFAAGGLGMYLALLRAEEKAHQARMEAGRKRWAEAWAMHEQVTAEILERHARGEEGR